MGLPPMFPMGGGENFWDEPDFVLTYIVTALVNGMGVEVGVTFMVRGVLVSGTMISEDSYLELLTQQLQNQISLDDTDAPEDAKEALKAVLDLRSLKEFSPEDYLPDVAPEDFDDDDRLFAVEDVDMGEGPPLLQHVHIKDPLIIASDQSIGFGEGEDVLYRLRLTSIDGWMVGRLMPNMPDDFPPDFDGLAH
jgi:hypothetical protein